MAAFNGRGAGHMLNITSMTATVHRVRRPAGARRGVAAWRTPASGSLWAMWGRGDHATGTIWGPPTVATIVGGVLIGAVLATLVVGGRPSEPSIDRSRDTTITRSLPARPALRPAGPAALGPEATVRRFYRRLGERRFEALYALVGDDFRARASLAEYAARRRTVERVDVRSVAIEPLAADRAGADIDVVLVEPAGRERCTGRLALTRARGRWRIDPGTVSCR